MEHRCNDTAPRFHCTEGNCSFSSWHERAIRRHLRSQHGVMSVHKGIHWRDAESSESKERRLRRVEQVASQSAINPGIEHTCVAQRSNQPQKWHALEHQDGHDLTTNSQWDISNMVPGYIYPCSPLGTQVLSNTEILDIGFSESGWRSLDVQTNIDTSAIREPDWLQLNNEKYWPHSSDSCVRPNTGVSDQHTSCVNMGHDAEVIKYSNKCTEQVMAEERRACMRLNSSLTDCNVIDDIPYQGVLNELFDHNPRCYYASQAPKTSNDGAPAQWLGDLPTCGINWKELNWSQYLFSSVNYTS